MSEIGGKTALITFGRSFLALHLARLMGAAGHNVLTADSMLFPITKFSAPVKKTFRTPRPRYEPVEWAQALAEIVRDESVDLVVPIHEGTAILANTIKQRPGLFPPDCTLFFPHFDLEARLENKYEFQVAVKRRRNSRSSLAGYEWARQRQPVSTLPFGQCAPRTARQPRDNPRHRQDRSRLAHLAVAEVRDRRPRRATEGAVPR